MQRELKDNWWNDYVGLPYVNNGRDRDGIDCWGLVRLIHSEVFGNNLPSFTEVTEEKNKEEVIAREKESWVKVESEKAGDVVLFRLGSAEIHVGLIIQPCRFIHAFEGVNSSIESTTSPKWKRRIVGIYRYSEEAKSSDIQVLPHPLKTKTINLTIFEGKTLQEIADSVREENNVPEEYGNDAVIFVDGYLIPKENWCTYIPKNGSRVEYRAKVGKGLGSVLKLAVMFVIAVYTPALLAEYGGAAFGVTSATTGLTSLTMLGNATMFAISTVAGMMMDAIFPVRPPSMDMGSQSYDNEQGASTYVVRGGSNKATPYGTIPVVLGKARYTPPSSINPYYEADGTSSYLRTALCWGYGPLAVDMNTLKIGETLTSTFSDIEMSHLEGYSTDNRTRFDELVAQDVEQLVAGVSLDQVTARVRSAVRNSNLLTVTTRNEHSFTIGTEVILGSTKDNSTAIGTVTAVANQDITFNNIGANETLLSDTGTAQDSDWYIQGVVWHERTLAEVVTQLKVTIEYPNGLYATDASSGAKSGYNSKVQIDVKPTSSGTWDYTKTLDITKKILSPFAQSVMFDVPSGTYDVRVKKLTRITHDSYNTDRVTFTGVTGFSNRKPITFPKPLCMTAIRAKGTNQFNGNVEGFNAEVQSICKDYDYLTNTWIERATSNPASLYRYVLQHPANANPLPDSKIDISVLEDWHNYCRTKGFTFNNVYQGQSSLNEVLKDVAAAGRASPCRIDGKRSVIIDRPRSIISQHFTPHNSWGFSGSKTLPKIPHGFRVQFNNEQKDYQQDEMIVYADGYSETNAELLEGLVLPGVTNPDIIYTQARFHLGQIILRPETYELNADIEHLVCTRGDLVKVAHDTTMWGLATGRIKEKLSATSLLLSEEIPMKAGTVYSIRFRSQDGSSIIRNVQPKPEDNHYNQINLDSAVDAVTCLPDDIFMFGSLNQETNDLVVLKIEPSSNMTAKLTLVDYSPEIYNLDTNPIPTFNSKISLPFGLLKKDIQSVPVISSIVSDDTALIETSSGKYIQGISVQFRNPASLPSDVTDIELQWDWAGDNTTDWFSSALIPLSKSSYIIPNVDVNDSYTLRARYVDSQGRSGEWTSEVNHLVTGRTRPPAALSVIAAEPDGINARISWQSSFENDVRYYEVRTSDTGWGDNSFVYKGSNTTCTYPVTTTGTYTFYIRPIADNGLYGSTQSVVFNYLIPNNISDIIASFHDTSNTTATITLDWLPVTNQFGVSGYELTYDSVTKFTNSTTITIPANWINDRSFTIKSVDNLGNKSSGFSKVITKLLPNSPTSVRTQVIDNTVMLYWVNADKTTLPISHVMIRKGATFETSVDVGPKSGGFTTINEMQAGSYTYWLTSVDTDGYESAPVSVTTTVSQPPDFVFHGSFTSTLNGTLVNAKLDNGVVVLPVNTTETFSSHFSTRSWTNPQDQVTAGYPIYIQPANLSGSYEEIFDFASVLASTKINVDIVGSIISGTPDVTVNILVSANGTIWTTYANTTDVFASNFRYVKVQVVVTGSTTSLYSVTQLVCRADAKQITDSGSIACLSTDTNGTLFNFNKEFIDVASLTATASGSTSITVVYDFLDSILSGTYSIVSNVCTINATAHGLITGQKVRVTFSGSTINQVLQVTSYTANSFTANIVSANESGTCNTYNQSARLYLFDANGNRVSGTASWLLRGY